MKCEISLRIESILAFMSSGEIIIYFTEVKQAFIYILYVMKFDEIAKFWHYMFKLHLKFLNS